MRPISSPSPGNSGETLTKTDTNMAKNEKTSPKVASKASAILRNPKSTPAQKSVAASALTQAANKTKKK
jgi:hypothetical protein